MKSFSPKEALQAAKQARMKGQFKLASYHYARVGIFLRKNKKYKEAKQLFDKAINLSPQSARLHLQRGIVALGLNEKEVFIESIKLFSQIAIQKNKISEYIPYAEKELKNFPLGRQLFFEAVLEVDRVNAKPFIGLAEALLEQNLNRRSLEILLEALNTKTEEEIVLKKIREILAVDKNLEAMGFLDQFEKKEIDINDLTLLLLENREETGKDKKHIPVSFKDLKMMIAELELEIEAEEPRLKKDKDTILPLLKEFKRKVEPILLNDTKARLDMAYAFFEMGLLTEAKDQLSCVEDTDQKYAEAQNLYVEILFNEGNYLGAMETLHKILRLEFLSTEVRVEASYKLAMTYFKLGDYKKTYTALTAIEENSGDYRDLKELKISAIEAGQLKEWVKKIEKRR